MAELSLWTRYFVYALLANLVEENVLYVNWSVPCLPKFIGHRFPLVGLAKLHLI